MIRPVLALERLTFLESEGKVGYWSGETGFVPETMDYLEFIARVTSHIPDKGQVMVRYCTEPAVVDRIIDHLKLTFVAEKPPPPQAAWQELLWEADPAAGFFPDPPAECFS
jgi:hypothetical protein